MGNCKLENSSVGAILPVIGELRELEDFVKDLRDKVTLLEERLSPILSPRPPQNKTSADVPEKCLSPVGNTIRGIKKEVVEIKYHINDLTSLLEIQVKIMVNIFIGFILGSIICFIFLGGIMLGYTSKEKEDKD